MRSYVPVQYCFVKWEVYTGRYLKLLRQKTVVDWWEVSILPRKTFVECCDMPKISWIKLSGVTLKLQNFVEVFRCTVQYVHSRLGGKFVCTFYIFLALLGVRRSRQTLCVSIGFPSFTHR